MRNQFKHFPLVDDRCFIFIMGNVGYSVFDFQKSGNFHYELCFFKIYTQWIILCTIS